MSSNAGKIILNQERFALTLDRLCYQLIEDWNDFEDACLVGIQPRGSLLATRIHQRLLEITGLPDIVFGKLDITFYRDDFRLSDKLLSPYPNEMDFTISGKQVLLIDDVLYTGRTIQAALAALQHFGRPAAVELLVLVDRRFNRHLPIQPDYAGVAVDALDEAYLKVYWKETGGEDKIVMFDKKE